MISNPAKESPVRVAVVGLGHFAQTAVLPAFAHANSCKLTALISSDDKKLETLKRKYRVEHILSYDEYDKFMHSGLIDAVYIVLPNDMHCDYTLRAAAAGIHILCEKPMAVTVEEGERMIRACKNAKVRLMVAYRLHFEAANLAAIKRIKNGELGQPRYFNSSFSLQVNDNNIRTKAVRGGGPLLDLGVYCINAARYLFQSEPLEVVALQSTKSDDPRFQEVEEQMGVTMRFSDDRLASFVCSFNTMENNFYEVVGTKGRLLVAPAYSHSEPLHHELSLRGKKTKKNKFPRRGQIAAEITYFAKCILNKKDPEPSGYEGLADLRIIEAIQKSAQEGGKAIAVHNIPPTRKPTIRQGITKPAHKKPSVIHVKSPHR
jgi:glucose-fructose oxidoreductase